MCERKVIGGCACQGRARVGAADCASSRVHWIDPFLRPLPALCQAINLKIASRKAARIRAMRRVVKRAIGQNPPPTVRALAIQLGYKDKKVLARYFAGLCAWLLARRKALAKSRLSNCGENYNPIHGWNPRHRWRQVCRKLNLKPLTASRRFPAEYKLIVAMYQQRRRLWHDYGGLDSDSELRFAAPQE